MTDEECGLVTSHLYGAMDELTDLVRHLNGSAGYAKRETRDCIIQLIKIEATLHRVVYRMQQFENQEKMNGD